MTTDRMAGNGLLNIQPTAGNGNPQAYQICIGRGRRARSGRRTTKTSGTRLVAAFSGLILAMRLAATADLTNGLVAYYPFNGNANDASGNGHDGTNDGAVLTTDRFGTPNAAYYFAGNGERISIPDSPALQLTGGYTLAAWINFEAGGTFSPRIIDKFTYSFWTTSTDAVRSLGMHLSSQNPWLVATQSLYAGQWYHVASSYDLQQRKIYVNGVLAASDSYALGVAVGTFPLEIGRKPSYGYDAFKGVIDDVCIYNRALSATEIQALYNVGGGQTALSNVRASQRAGTTLVDVWYDLGGATTPVVVSVSISTNGGASYDLQPANLTGDGVTAPVGSGTSLHVVWNAGADLGAGFFPSYSRPGGSAAVLPVGLRSVCGEPAGAERRADGQRPSA